MKPSERIKQLMEEEQWRGNEWVTYVPAILKYLDEQYEKSKEGA